MRTTLTFVEIRTKRGLFWQKIGMSFYYTLWGALAGMAVSIVFPFFFGLTSMVFPFGGMLVGAAAMVWAVWKNSFLSPPPGKTIAQAIAELPER